MKREQLESMYNDEAVLSHVASVAYKMYTATMFQDKRLNKMATTIAILHDMGNDNGRISADLAREFLWSNENFTDEERNLIYIVIHQHKQLKLHTEEIVRNIYITGFKQIYGTEAFELLEMLDVYDTDDSDYQDIKEGYRVIEEFEDL